MADEEGVVMEGYISAETLAAHPDAVDALKYTIARLLLKSMGELQELAVFGNEIVVDGDTIVPDESFVPDPRIQWREHVHDDGGVHVAGYLAGSLEPEDLPAKLGW